MATSDEHSQRKRVITKRLATQNCIKGRLIPGSASKGSRTPRKLEDDRKWVQNIYLQIRDGHQCVLYSQMSLLCSVPIAGFPKFCSCIFFTFPRRGINSRTWAWDLLESRTLNAWMPDFLISFFCPLICLAKKWMYVRCQVHTMDQDEKFQAVNNQRRLIILDGLAVSVLLREKMVVQQVRILTLRP